MVDAGAVVVADAPDFALVDRSGACNSQPTNHLHRPGNPRSATICLPVCRWFGRDRAGSRIRYTAPTSSMRSVSCPMGKARRPLSMRLWFHADHFEHRAFTEADRPK
jgi:hypothetical protein